MIILFNVVIKKQYHKYATDAHLKVFSLIYSSPIRHLSPITRYSETADQTAAHATHRGK